MQRRRTHLFGCASFLPGIRVVLVECGAVSRAQAAHRVVACPRRGTAGESAIRTRLTSPQDAASPGPHLTPHLPRKRRAVRPRCWRAFYVVSRAAPPLSLLRATPTQWKATNRLWPHRLHPRHRHRGKMSESQVVQLKGGAVKARPRTSRYSSGLTSCSRWHRDDGNSTQVAAATRSWSIHRSHQQQQQQRLHCHPHCPLPQTQLSKPNSSSGIPSGIHRARV